MAERLVARLQRDAREQDVIALFRCLDDLADASRELGDSGVDLRPELTRIETVHNILRDKAPSIVSTLRRLETTRAEVDPPADHWWWTLDRRLAEPSVRS